MRGKFPKTAGRRRDKIYRISFAKKIFQRIFFNYRLVCFCPEKPRKTGKNVPKSRKNADFSQTGIFPQMLCIVKKLHKYNILWFFCFNVQNVATATHIEPVVVVYFVSQPKGRKCGDVAPFVRRNIYKLNRGEKNENYQEKRSGNGVRSQ